MGVSVCHYYGYGVLIKKDKIDSFVKHVLFYKGKKDGSKFEDDIEFHDHVEKFHDNSYEDKINEGFTIISDGMNGRYIFFGKILKKSSKQPFEDPVEFNEVTEDQKNEIKEWLRIEFNSIVSSEKIKSYYIPHWH